MQAIEKGARETTTSIGELQNQMASFARLLGKFEEDIKALQAHREETEKVIRGLTERLGLLETAGSPSSGWTSSSESPV